MTATVAVLAGGRGSRIGGDKALALLDGAPLILHSLRCAQRAMLDACVVAKRGTRLPQIDVPVLLEPDEPTHPLCGIVAALRTYPTVIALPCDMPFLPQSVLTGLAGAAGTVVLAAEGQPFPALYRATLLPELERALAAETSLRTVLSECGATALDGVDPTALSSVNSTADLKDAQQRLDAERRAATRHQSGWPTR